MSKLLVVVDYQNDFVNGVLGIPGSEKIDEAICSLIKYMKEKGYHIIYTMDTHSPAEYKRSAEGKSIPMHCEFNTEGWKLYGETGKLLQDKDLNAFRLLKDTMGYTDWWDFLYDYIYGEEEIGPVEEVELCGLDFCYCVFQNAVTLRNIFPKARVIVNYNACDTSDDAMAAALVDYLKRVGVEVVGFD